MILSKVAALYVHIAIVNAAGVRIPLSSNVTDNSDCEQCRKVLPSRESIMEHFPHFTEADIEDFIEKIKSSETETYFDDWVCNS